MNILTQLLVGIGAISLIVIIGTFVGISMVVVEDMIEEYQQAKEREKLAQERRKRIKEK